MNGAVRVSRCVAVWAGVTAGTVALLAWLATTTTRPGGSDVVGWLTAGCTVLFLGGAVIAYDPSRGLMARKQDTGGNG